MQQRNPWDNDAIVPIGGGMVITKPATAKDQAETSSAQSRARQAAAAVPYIEQGAADDAAIKHAQALEAQRKADQAAAQAKFEAMAPTSNVHGDAYLQQFVPANMRATVQAYARGDLGSRAGGISGQMLPIIQHAINYDPSFSASTFPARSKMQADLAGGDPKTLGGGLRAMEQMIFHARDVLHNGAALDNYDATSGIGQLAAYGANGIRARLHPNDPRFTAYNQSVINYAPESQKGVAGAAGIGAERGERHDAYSAALSQSARAAALQQDATMAFQRTGALNDQYKRLMGKDIVDLLPGEARKAYNEVMAGGYDQRGNALHPALNYDAASGNGGGYTGGPEGPGSTDPTIASGNTRAVDNVQANRIIDSMIRAGAGDDAINSALTPLGLASVDPRQTSAARAYLAKNPNYKGSFGGVQAQQPTTMVQRALASPMGTFVASANNALSGGLSGRLTGTGKAVEALAKENPTAATLGDIAGAVGGAGITGGLLGAAARGVGGGLAARALANPITADAAYGGLTGATSSADNPLGGGLAGAVLGAAGGMFGRGVTRLAGQTARGVQNGAVRYLRDAGVPLTAGQVLSQSGRVGQIVKATEDKLTSAPVVGDMIRARRIEGVQGFDRAAFDEALDPIGMSTNGAIGEQGVDAALDASGQGYRNALAGRSIRGDAPFRADVANASARGSSAPTYGNDFQAIMSDEVAPIVRGSPNIDGNQFQQLKRTLGGYGRQYDRIANGTPLVPPSPMARNVSGAFGDLEGALDSLVQRQAPDLLPAYNAANTAYRNVKIVQKAVEAARNGTRVGEPGTFAASQLADAANANARTFGNSAGTTQQPFYELTRAGQAVLPSSIPDSGTAGRLASLALPSALGGGIGFAAGDAKSGGEAGLAGGLGLGALLALGGTRGGQAALTRAILDRPQWLTRIGNNAVENARIGGMFGAGLGLLPVAGQ